LLTTILTDWADLEEGYVRACDATIDDMGTGYDLGTQGRIHWTRDSLYER